MNVAFGLKAHSGWAALVVLGQRDGQLQVVERRRLELVEKDAEDPPGIADELHRRDPLWRAILQGGEVRRGQRPA